MGENTSSADDEQRLAELYDAWTVFDDTGDESAILPVLADDVVVLPPDHDPIIGKEAATDWYARVDPSDGEWSSQNRELVLDSDLAVNRMTTDGEFQGEAIQFQGMAIYEKRDGRWKLRFDIWNRSESPRLQQNVYLDPDSGKLDAVETPKISHRVVIQPICA